MIGSGFRSSVGGEPVGGTLKATADFVRSEAVLWKRVIADAGITAE